MKSIQAIMLFFVLFIGGFHTLPYLLTNERYQDNTAINNNFIIVLSKQEKPQIINWRKYNINSVESNVTLYKPSKEISFKLERNELVTIKPIGDLYQVNVYKDDYTFYCTYKIVNNKVIPVKFRFTGAFMVIYAFLFAIFSMCLIHLTKCIKQKRTKPNKIK